MKQAGVALFAIWTSVMAALFYFFYSTFTTWGIGWVMFVCMAVFFGMNVPAKNCWKMMLSAIVGVLWGLLDFALMALFGMTGMNSGLVAILAIIIGTFILLYVHLKLIPQLPISMIPFIFAGLCTTFSQGGQNIGPLIATLIIGICLASVCGIMLTFCLKKFPLAPAAPQDAAIEEKAADVAEPAEE